MALMEQFINYANYVKDQRSQDQKEEEVAAGPVLFTAGPGDLPLLPPPVHGARSTEIARQAKEIIRAYFLRHYRKSHIICTNEMLSIFYFRTCYRR
jgi:hypothetical protein